MRKAFKFLALFLLAIIVIIVGVAAYVKFALPSVGDPPDLVIEKTPQRLARGEYLANAVMACTDCHTTRNWTKFGGPLFNDSVGGGSPIYGKQIGLPGEFHSKNITPYHLGNWTDGELLRALTTGVSKDGRALFPIMPYLNFGKMDKEDIYSVIAYIRTLPAVKKDIAPSQAEFPVNFIINTYPTAAAFSARPAETNTVAYGQYLVNAAACGECHSKAEKGAPVPGMEFAGGNVYTFNGMSVTSANITPHETGLKGWTRKAFISRFKMYADSNYSAPSVGPGDFNTPMPWYNFAQMNESDLGAIYDYLQTIKPVKNSVIKYVRDTAKANMLAGVH